MSNKLISYKNAIDTMDDIKSKKIDIKATIENTKKADFLGVEESYCQAIDSDDLMPAYFSELVGSEDLSPKEYYENVFEYLEKDNGIYIALCYLVDGIGIDEDNLKFNDNSSLEDDYLIIVDKDFEELIAEYHELDTDFMPFIQHLSNAYQNMNYSVILQVIMVSALKRKMKNIKSDLVIGNLLQQDLVWDLLNSMNSLNLEIPLVRKV